MKIYILQGDLTNPTTAESKSLNGDRATREQICLYRPTYSRTDKRIYELINITRKKCASSGTHQDKLHEVSTFATMTRNTRTYTALYIELDKWTGRQAFHRRNMVNDLTWNCST